jgi:uracil-DNA glycosylase
VHAPLPAFLRMRLRLGSAAALLSISSVPRLPRARARPFVALARGAWELPPSWSEALPNIESSAGFEALRAAIDDERSRHDVLPSAAEQFAAFEACAFDAVRVVLLGQDPYPTPSHPMGLSFSVRAGVAPPPSLRNIYTELERDLGVPPASHGCLDAWAAQGVFLLNSALTVRASEAG